MPGSKILEKHFTIVQINAKTYLERTFRGMTPEELCLIKRLTSEIELIGKKPEKLNLNSIIFFKKISCINNDHFNFLSKIL